MSLRGLYNIPSYADFGAALARGLLKADLDLANALILLPNRRASRTLQTTFLRLREGEAMLLPRMVPMGDLSDEDAVGEAIVGGIDADALPDTDLDLSPPWPKLRREAALAELVAKKDASLSADHVMALAQELSRLMDQIETEGLKANAFKTLVEGAELAVHWEKSLLFLEILYEVWPQVEAEAGYISPAMRRRVSIENQIRSWRLSPPRGPVIAAGSTGSIPATRALLAAVLKLPQGAVVLPGMDPDLSPATWAEIEHEITHPQYGFHEVLKGCEQSPDQVQLWPGLGDDEHGREPRTQLLSKAMLPAETTASLSEGWRAGVAGLSTSEIESAFEDVTLYEAPDDDIEAQTIALALREGLDRPAYVSALVTPDRGLAERVKGHLQRWGIEPDDSAGLRLEDAPAFKFARIVLDVVEGKVEHFDLLSLLHHPLCQMGLGDAVRMRGRAALDLHVLRNTASGNGFTPLINWLDANPKIQGRQAAFAVLDRVIAATQDMRLEADTAENPQSWTALSWLIALVEAIETLSMPQMETDPESDTDTDSADGLDAEPMVWAQTGAEGVIGFLMEWAETLVGREASSQPVSLPQFRALLERAANGRTLRSPFTGHPRVLILGGIEARLTSVDRIILGGLNEGTWPAETQPGPWMSRPMRRAFGLPPVERRIGLAAHDFCQSFGRREVIMTRSAMVDGGATVPSRFIKRLKAFLKIVGAKHVLEPREVSLMQAASDLDAVERVSPERRPRPKPPLSARPRVFAVTDVERWKANPFEFYAKHTLRLRALRPLGGQIDAAVRGTIIHDALEAVLKAHTGALAPSFAESVYEALFSRFQASGLPEPQLALWRPRLRKAAAWFADTERQFREYDRFPAAIEDQAEYSFDVGHERYTLRCRADRIDVTAENDLVVVDYKSGAVPSGVDVKSGDKPQLALEAALIGKDAFPKVNGALPVAGLEYWQISGRGEGGSIEFRPGKGASAADISALVDRTWDDLRALIAAYQDEQRPFMARVVRKGDYIELARQDEWEGGDHDD